VRPQPIAHSQHRSLLYRSCPQTFSFELPQVLPEHLDCYSWHGAPKATKSEGATAEAANNHWLPATLNYANRSVNGTLVTFDIACTAFVHVPYPSEHRTLKCLLVKATRMNLHSGNMASARLFRVILPVSNIEDAAVYYSAVFGQPGIRVSPGRHYFGCGGAILACFDPRADGDAWDARPNPDHVYFAVDDLDEYYRRVSKRPNGSVLRPIETQPWGERSFYCMDPFANKLCFVAESTMFTGGLI
jgi:predicted enzyme related to lactoylglutathione lyase